jgi:hypothetical protein
MAKSIDTKAIIQHAIFIYSFYMKNIYIKLNNNGNAQIKGIESLYYILFYIKWATSFSVLQNTTKLQHLSLEIYL